MNNEHLAPYMKPVPDSEKPEVCMKCVHRHMLRWLLNIPFCEHSSYTCHHRTKPCTDFEREPQAVQLELF